MSKKNKLIIFANANWLESKSFLAQ
jgi:hypothetical protein